MKDDWVSILARKAGYQSPFLPVPLIAGRPQQAPPLLGPLTVWSQGPSWPAQVFFIWAADSHCPVCFTPVPWASAFPFCEMGIKVGQGAT